MTPNAKSLSEDTIEKVCERHGVGGEDIFLVQALMTRPQGQWPGCCGSGCMPCMDNVTAAALELLELERKLDEQ